MVVCPPARVLVSMIDRYGLEHWMKGIYGQNSEGIDDGQVLDVAEDMIHLLIVLLSDRTSLMSNSEEPNPHVRTQSYAIMLEIGLYGSIVSPFVIY